MSNKIRSNLALVGFSLLVLFFIFLIFRNSGLYPSVFADEYAYSKLSRLLPLSESTVPGYLYLKLYSITNYCGDGFLGCARIINALVFVMAAPFIYLTARRVADTGVSAVVTFLAVIGPINSYTAYFMPESFYFLSFWVFCWYLLSLSTISGKWHWFIAGVIYAFSALIKPHSIFFLPAVLTYIGFIFYREQSLFSKQAFWVLSSFLLGALVSKFGLSYILAGSAGLTIFGPLYGSIASSTASATERFIQLFLLALENLKGHLLVIGLIYGLPLLLAVVATVRALFLLNDRTVNRELLTSQYEKLSFFSSIVILNLICVVALFTASVASTGLYETPYRLHMRYYNFALPLFYLVAAGALSALTDVKKTVRLILSGIFTAIGIWAIWSNLTPYTPGHVDSPEIRGLHFDRLYFQLVGGLLISSVVLWLFSQQSGLRLYLYLALPFFVVISNYHVGLDLNNRLSQDVYDKAGIFTKQYLTNEDLTKTLVVGSDEAGLFRSLYHLDNENASLEVIQRGDDYDLKNLTAGKEWLLVVGDHDIKGTPFYQIQMSGFTLIQATRENILDFKKGVWPGLIRKVRGLSTPERWGTWSQGDVVEFVFSNSLPGEFELHLFAKAFGPNANKHFEVFTGGSSVSFSLSAASEEKIIRLKNPEGSNIIRFKIPNPVSPKNIGLSSDDRDLGIFFVEMKLVTIE